MSSENQGGSDHVEKPGGEPISVLLSAGTSPLQWDKEVVVSEFIEGQGEVGVSSQLLILGTPEMTASL